jgi:hypothetical protein
MLGRTEDEVGRKIYVMSITDLRVQKMRKYSGLCIVFLYMYSIVFG